MGASEHVPRDDDAVTRTCFLDTPLSLFVVIHQLSRNSPPTTQRTQHTVEDIENGGAAWLGFGNVRLGRGHAICGDDAHLEEALDKAVERVLDARRTDPGESKSKTALHAEAGKLAELAKAAGGEVDVGKWIVQLARLSGAIAGGHSTLKKHDAIKVIS